MKLHKVVDNFFPVTWRGKLILTSSPYGWTADVSEPIDESGDWSTVTDFAKALIWSVVQVNGADSNTYFVVQQIKNQCIKKLFLNETNQEAKITDSV